MPLPAEDRAAERSPFDRSREPTDAEKLALVLRVLDLIPDFFYVHDYELRFRYANRGAAKYFGIDEPSELIGRQLKDVDPNTDQVRFFEKVCREVMDAGVPRQSADLPYSRRDGSRGFLRQHDIPFINPKTGEQMLLGLSRDITVERELEAQRSRSAALQRELEIAREVQESLRPSAALRAPGVGIASFAEPAEFAGGDFFDWAHCPDGKFLVGLGDVTGHGVGPALLASACRAYVRALVMMFPLPEAMVNLNELMCLDAKDGRFATFAIAHVDPASFEVEMLSAGQGPIFIVGGPGEPVRSMMPRLMPLGVQSGMAVPEPERFVLPPGGSMVMVSDGLFEARSPAGEEFGLPRLREVLAACAGQPTERVVERLVGAARAHAAGRPWTDDVTLLVVGRG